MISSETFTQTLDLIEQRTGLQIDPQRDAHRRHDLATLLAQLEAQYARGDSRELLRLLRGQRVESALWQAVIAPLAIGETYFFRDDAQFQLLESETLPTLIAQRRQQQHLHLAIWSAGCATGEEPYSLAILLRRLLPDIAHWSITLLATDINQRALEIARRAVYRPWSFRLRHLDLSSAFQTVREGVQLKPEIRRMVRFECGHLLDGAVFSNGAASLPPPRFDIVFCRNVLLYFSPAQVQVAEQVLARAVVPGGWLFLGHSESLSSASNGISARRAGTPAVSEWERQPQMPVYRRNDTTAAPPFKSSVEDRSESIYRPDTPLLRPLALSKTAAAVTIRTAIQAKEHYALAITAYRDHEMEEAGRLARELIFAQPNHARSLLLLAYIAADRQAMDEARSYIERALRQDRLLADAYYLRALLHQEAGENISAEAALRATLYCQRDHALTLYSLGQALAEAGNNVRATQLWQQLRLALKPRAADEFVSDYSDVRVGRLRALLDA